ncbi:hypothetical protein GCM10027443_10200 [Pontibacter brevis]
MENDLFHLFGKSSKKVFFLYNLRTQQFEYLNEAVERIWEVSRELVLTEPKHLFARIHPDDKEAVVKRFREMKEEGTAQEMELSLVLDGDVRKEVKIDAYSVRDQDGNQAHVAGVAEDVTKQSQYIDYLREFSRRKNSALEIIAHDLRGPLSIVKSVSNLLESEHQEKKYDEISTYTNIIAEAYENCLSIITDVLRDEHLQSPTIYVNIQRFDLVEAVQKLLYSYQVANGIEHTFELVAGEEKIMVELDEVKLMQVLNNLLSNSIKFTSPGGRIQIELRKENKRLLVIHSDNGIGIPKELQPHIFERYSRATRKGLRGEPTTGVGLAIVRELVEVQGGKIWVESEENQGAAFYLSLPLPDE